MLFAKSWMFIGADHKLKTKYSDTNYFLTSFAAHSKTFPQREQYSIRTRKLVTAARITRHTFRCVGTVTARTGHPIGESCSQNIMPPQVGSSALSKILRRQIKTHTPTLSVANVTAHYCSSAQRPHARQRQAAILWYRQRPTETTHIHPCLFPYPSSQHRRQR